MLKGPNQSGFSLIELLMVVIIVGVLATIAVPSLMASRDAAQKAAAIGALRTIHSNQTTYMSQKGRYARITELNTYFGNSLGTTSGSWVVKGNYAYISTSTNLTTLATRYQLWAATYENRSYLIVQFTMEQNGVIQGVAP